MAGADVARGSVLLTPRFDNLTSSISKQLNGAFSSSSKIGSSAGATLGTSFNSSMAAKMGAISGILSSITSKAMSAVSSSIGDAVSRVDTLNQFPKVMEKLGFSSESATKTINRLSDGIEGLPTHLDDITASTQKIALLTGDLDGATDTALALNNAFLFSGSSSADAARGLTQYVQMLSRGKPDAQSWNSILETMGPALKEVASKLGYTSTMVEGDLYTALQDGTLSFDDFNAAIVECNSGVDGFASGAATASAGIATSASNAAYAVTKNMANIINAINGNGLISGAFDTLKNAINGIGGLLTPLAARIGTELPNAFSKVSGYIQTFKDRLSEIESSTHVFQTLKAEIKTIADTVKFTVDSALTPFKETLGQLFNGGDGSELANTIANIAIRFTQMVQISGGMVSVIQQVKTVAQQALQAIATFMEPLQTTIGMLIPELMNMAQAILPMIANNVNVLADIFANLWPVLNQIVQTVIPIISQIVQTVAPAITTISTAVGGLCNTVIAFVSSLMPLIQNLVSVILPLIAPIVQTIVAVTTTLVAIGQQLLAFLQPIIADVVTLATNLISILTPAIQSICTFIQTVMPVIQAVISAALTVISTIWNAVFPVLESVATSVFSAISGLISSVMSVITDVINIALAIVSGDWDSAWNGCLQLISDIWNGIIDGIQSGIDVVTALIGALPSTIVNLFSGAGNLLFGIGKSIIDGLWNGMKAIWDNVTGWLSSLGGVIQSLKGPIQKDRKLLIPQGAAIIESLQAGFEKNIDDFYGYVGGIAGNIQDAFAAESVTLALSARANDYTESQKQRYSAAVNNIQDDTASISLARGVEKLIDAINDNKLGTTINGLVFNGDEEIISVTREYLSALKRLNAI